MEFVRLLDEVRHTVGFPLRVNSGFRTAFHNSTLANAKPDSAHLRGWAADIKCTTSRHRFAIVMAAMAVGIQRVGVSRLFIHLDCDPGKPPRMCWVY